MVIDILKQIEAKNGYNLFSVYRLAIGIIGLKVAEVSVYEIMKRNPRYTETQLQFKPFSLVGFHNGSRLFLNSAVLSTHAA
jgi:hypothetical protein